MTASRQSKYTDPTVSKYLRPGPCPNCGSNSVRVFEGVIQPCLCANLTPQARRKSWNLGTRMALELLGEADRSADDWALRSEGRNGGAQDNQVHAYMSKVRDLNDGTAMVAFCAVLSDFIAHAVDGAAPDVATLRLASRAPVSQRQWWDWAN